MQLAERSNENNEANIYEETKQTNGENNSNNGNTRKTGSKIEDKKTNRGESRKKSKSSQTTCQKRIAKKTVKILIYKVSKLPKKTFVKNAHRNSGSMVPGLRTNVLSVSQGFTKPTAPKPAVNVQAPSCTAVRLFYFCRSKHHLITNIYPHGKSNPPSLRGCRWCVVQR